MRSVVVVLPASMWAMMPMFLHRSNGTVLGTALLLPSGLQTRFCHPEATCFSSPEELRAINPALLAKLLTRAFAASLPPVMRERLVGFRHAMYIFFLLDGGAAAIGGIQQLVAQLVNHSLFAARPGIGNDPADRQRRPPVGIHFHRHLIVRAAHAPGFHFEQRLRVFHRLLEQLQRLVAALRFQARKRFVEDAFGGRALTLPHHRVDDLRHQVLAVKGISPDRPFCDISFTRHSTPVETWLRNVSDAAANCVSTSFLSPSSAASRRTSNVPACGWRHPRHRAFRESRDNARPADLSRGRPGSARWSAPAGCGQRLEYRSSLQFRSSGARAPLCARPSSASWAFAYRRGCIHRASADIPAKPGWPSCTGAACGPRAPID